MTEALGILGCCSWWLVAELPSSMIETKRNSEGEEGDLEKKRSSRGRERRRRLACRFIVLGGGTWHVRGS